MPEFISLVSVVVSAAAALFTWRQASLARRAVHQAALMRLFSSFDAANQATLTHPDLLRTVHGLSDDVDVEEARRIAYLSILMDGFQHFYSEHHDGDFSSMVATLERNPTFLNRILRVPENQGRWQRMKRLYYEDFDFAFMTAIDSLIEFERSRITPSQDRT